MAARSGVEADRDTPADRRELVRRDVLETGYARIDDLARRFGVSVMTVHRDLDLLAEEGWLTKIRGGATANPSALLDAGVRERSQALQGEKRAIAAQARHLLGRGQTVFLDDSTTAMALLPHLEAVAPITVATNFLPVVQGVATMRGVEVIVLGGQYFPLQEACLGPATVDAITELRADVVFLSTTAVNAGACYHRSELTVMVKRALLASSARSVLLVDHAKFGRPAPHLLCAVGDVDVVIVDAGIDPEDLEHLRTGAVAVEVAEPL